MPSDPKLVQAVFLAAVDQPASDRAATLDRECGGNEELRQRVEALLEAHDKPGDFLESRSPAIPKGVTVHELLAESPGTVIGAYKLLQQIGEGGMGTVFMAEQTEPVKRKVALKIINPGMDSRQIIARFEAERQALAMMDHPNIAKVLDAGTTKPVVSGQWPVVREEEEQGSEALATSHLPLATAGRPYFVMELVKGVPITKFCDDHHLTPRERLELFLPVCRAVQHAHQKGIIHRDLKPSNVLVALYDDKPVPKIIDFGVAKATGPKLTDRTMFTQFGQMVGTLEYMSPEQASFNALDIDTRSDIYSLGVLLYELLTGTTPLSRKRLKEAAFDEMLRIIREEEPPKPSTRLSTTQELPSIAACRKTEPHKLGRLLKGDLDWVVMKCLEKERGRRYETANGLALEIQRYLADEPVEACPPSVTYVLRKFAHKNRRVLITAGAFVLLLAAAALASTWQAIRATLAETKARQAETNARRAQEVAENERQQAVTNLYHARVEEAASLRRARGMGYRAQVFNRLQLALQLDTPDKDIDRLRDEAVACLGDFVGLEPVTWEDFPAQIQKIALTPDGKQMAIALVNGTIQLRSVGTGSVVAQLGESAVDMGIDPANRWLVTGGATGTIRVWQDYGTARVPAGQTIEMHAELVGMARNGRFAVGYTQEKDGGWLSVWDVARQEIKARLQIPFGKPEGPLQVSDDGQWVAQASRDGTNLYALVWNTLAPGPKKITFAETYQDTAALSISPDGGFLACKHGDDGLILLDVHESRPRPLIRSHEVAAASFSGDGRFLVYHSIAGRVRLWGVSDHQEVAALDHPGKGGRETFLTTFSADSSTFATANGVSHSIRIWKLAGSGEKLVLPVQEGGVPCVAFSPDGKVLASGSKDRLVKLWDTATGRLLRTLPRFQSPIQSISFSPDGCLLATGQFGPASQPVQIWDLATLQALAAPEDELGRCAYGVAFTPDGKILAACGDGLTLWRLAEDVKGAGNAPRLSLERMTHLPGQRSIYLCISPNSKLLAWVDRNFSVCLWDLANGREIPFTGPSLSFGWGNLAFYPDSNHLTFGSARVMVEAWDTRTMRQVSTLGRGAGVTASPDCRWLVASYAEAQADALWSSQTGSRVFFLPQERGEAWSHAWSPDGKRLAIGLAEGGLAIWNVSRMETELTRIGLAWRGDARAQQQAPQSFVVTTPRELKLQVMHYSNLGKRLAWVGRIAEAEDAYRAALRVKPDDRLADGDLGKFLAQAHEYFGKFLEDQARYPEAEAEFSETIKLQPEHGSFWVQRGWVRADRGQWDKASADFVQATRCQEPEADVWHSRVDAWHSWAAAWHSRAMLYLQDGNQGGYRQICADMLQRFGEEAAWTCALTPNSGAEPDRIAELAEKLLAKSSRDHEHVTLLGAAFYRAGRFEEALKRLTEATELNAGPYRTNMLHTCFFLAMAHYRLGHADEARRWLDKGIQGTEQSLKWPAKNLGKSGNSEGAIGPNWIRKLTLQLLRYEAEQLIQGQGAKPEK